MCAMAFKHREEIVGKRFLSVCGSGKLKLSKISEWEWRAGIVRAASHKDPKHPELTILVEFDDVDWKRREWIRVYDEDAFLLFFVEDALVWALRKASPLAGAAKNLYWPALSFKPLVDKVHLSEHRLKPAEYLVDKKLDFVNYSDLRVYQESDGESHPATRDYPEVRKAIKQWAEFQDGQRILVTTPSVLVGYRVEVYRAEGTTQWYTAVIVSYNENTRELTLTDDTVLEEHNEDPCLVQMKLIGDGVVESILKGENVGITPRRRACTSHQNPPVHYSTRTRSNPAHTYLTTSRLTATAIVRKSRNRLGIDGIPRDNPPTPLPADKVGGIGLLDNSSRGQVERRRKVSESDATLPLAAESRVSCRRLLGVGEKLPEESLPRSTRRSVKSRFQKERTLKDEDTDSAEEEDDKRLQTRRKRDSPSRNSFCLHDNPDGQDDSRYSDESDVSKRTENSNHRPNNSTDKVIRTRRTTRCGRSQETNVDSKEDICRKTSLESSELSKDSSSRLVISCVPSRSSSCSEDSTDPSVLCSPKSTSNSCSWTVPVTAVVSSVSVVLTPLSPSVVSAAVGARDSPVEIKSESVEANPHCQTQESSGPSPQSSGSSEPPPPPTPSVPCSSDSSTRSPTPISVCQDASAKGADSPPKLPVSEMSQLDRPDRPVSASFSAVNSGKSSPVPPGGPAGNPATKQVNNTSDNHSPKGSVLVSEAAPGKSSKDRGCSSEETRKAEDKTCKHPSPLGPERHEPVRVYRDPHLVNSSVRHVDCLHHGLMHPAGLSHSAAAAAAYPRVPSLPQHTRAPGTPLPATHIAPYGLSSHLLSPHVPAPTAAAAGSHLDQHSLHSQYRHILLPPHYSSPVGLDMLSWQQKYPPHLTTPSHNPWMVAHYQEELRLERERVLVQERDRQNRIERERREEQERLEREKAEREKVEKERAERERQEKERQERERQERERLEREERERVQREAVQQHFEESLRIMQKQKMGWSPMSTLPLSKPHPSPATVGHNNPTASMSQSSHNQAIHSADLEQTRDKNRDKEAKERFGSVDTRLRQDHERWITVVPPRNETVTALQQSLTQNISPTEARPGSGQPKPEGYPLARSSPHSSSNISGHTPSKSGIAPSPVSNVHSSSGAAMQHKQEPSFSLYGYQPFQHTYITQAQLKAREESKGSSSIQQVMAPSGRQSTIKQEKEANIPFERPTTPSSSRTGSSANQSTLLSSKQQLKIMHPQSQDRTSPMYQPLVGGGGAFKPYEYSSHSPAPAHQNTSSPTLTGRMGGASYHPSHQEQPQNLVKGDSKGTVHDHSTSQSQTHHKYDSSRPPASTPPTAAPTSYTPPYTGSKNASPVTSATYSYSLIQQGLVPNPLYTPAHSGASTTSGSTITTATPASPQAPSKPPSQAGSPPMAQQYPRATPGAGITSGTPICRPSSVPYPIHQSRSTHSYSPGGSATTPGLTPSRTSTPQEAHSSNRPHISTPGSNHRSPSPAHLYGVSPASLPQPSTPTPPLHASRVPPSTSPRMSTTPNSSHINRVPLHSGTSPLPTISPPQPSSTPENQAQPQPLNLQNSGTLVKRKTSKDGNGRKRQKTNEEHLLPPQLQPQVLPDNSPPVSQLGTPPQLVSNTPISMSTPFSNSTSGTNNSSSAVHGQTQPGASVGHPPQSFSPSDAPSVTLPSETSTSASGISSSHGSGFMDSFCSFVSSAQQDQYQTYYNKHAKGRNKAASEHSSGTPSEITDSFVRPSSNSNSSAASLQSTGGGSQESAEESRVSTSPASSTSALNTTSATSVGSSSNHTKLKKAWLQRHSENEDKKNPSEGAKPETPTKSTVSETTSLVNEVKTVITSSTSTAKSSSTTTTVTSRESRTSSSSGGGSTEGNSVNGLGVKNQPAETPAEDDSTSSASETEQELKNFKRKTRVSRKTASAVTNSNNNTTSSTSGKRQKVSSESQNDSLEEMPNIKKETNKRKCVPPERETTNNSRRRGRKTKGRCSAPEEPQKKKSPKPPEKPSLARLKRTGEPFLQDGPCCEVAPKLPKCRECRMTPHQRSKKMPNIFCRFYAYRKLRYGKNGTILGAGFSEPSDAAESDLCLWLPPVDSPPTDLEMETSKFLLTHVGDQFCDLVEQEQEAQSLHMSEDKTITWKRVVQGVREMCDVCETTLFNFHWVCHKCGFVVCIDCYKARKNGTVKEEQSPPKDRDEYQWLLCSNRQPHEQEKLMMTQIIAGSALWDVGKLLHEVRRKWNIPAYCNCSNKDDSDSKHSANGICKLMNAVTKCFSSDKDPLQVNGISECPRLTRKSGKGSVNGVIKQEDGLSGYSSESGGSPLSWLADVALNSSGKLKEDRKKSKLKTEDDDDEDTKDDKNSESQLDGADGLGDSDDERSENFSTLRELLIRPTGKLGGKSSGTNSNSKKTLTSTLDEVISCVIEQRVRKSDKKSKDEKQLVHFTRRYQQSRSGRELLPIRACALDESTLLYPDIPHVWLCSGILLLLKDPSHSGNLQLFQEQWKRGQPVLVGDLSKKLDSSLWSPDSFIRDFGDVKNDFINCKTGAVLPNLPMRKFWEGFENASKRLKDEDGDAMLLKLKDWPPGEEFSELLPQRFQDIMKVLPLPQYTSRGGCFNLASCLPDCFVRPDLGPKMHSAYGSPQLSPKGTTNLHLDISDSVNVMVYVGIPKDDNSAQETLRVIDESGCDTAMKRRSREKGTKPGAIWHIYNARDADKIRDLLNKVAEEKGKKLEPHHDSIHSREWYMDEELRNRLYKEYGVEGYAVVQCMGDSLFIPAGAPHQVCNLYSCAKVAADFVSPESVGKCFALTQEFRHLSDTNTYNEDKLQIKNIIYHAVKDVLALLEANSPEDSKT